MTAMSDTMAPPTDLDAKRAEKETGDTDSKPTGADLVKKGKAAAEAKKTTKKAVKKTTKKPAAKKTAKKATAKTPASSPEPEVAKIDPAALEVSPEELRAMGLDPEIFATGRLAIDIKKVTFEQWAKTMGFLIHLDTEHKWWIGDAFRLGVERWGNEAHGIFVSETYDETTIGNYQWVAEKHLPADRDHRLTWTHHREASAAHLNRKQRKQCLKWCWDNPQPNGKPASTRLLAGHVASLKPEDPTTPTEKKIDHTYRLSFRLKVAEEEQGDAILAKLESQMRALEAEFGVELLGVEVAKS